MLRVLPRGLRARFVVAFVLAVAFGTLLSASFIFHRARWAIVEGTKNSAVADLRTQLNSLAPHLPFPPDQAELRGLALELDQAGRAAAWRSSAAYQGGDPVPASPDRPPVPKQLRMAVQDKGQAAYQRIEWKGRLWLDVGMPVAYADSAPDKAGRLSGLTVYVSLPLDDDQKHVAALVSAAFTGAVPSLALAIVPAMLAARSVLRPVRRLRHGAERISRGELDVRLHAEGHDELAELTRSFDTMATILQEDDAQRRRMEAGARRFAADVAHELRTPLAAMTPVTDFLAEDAKSHLLPPDTADAVRLISEKTRALARMVEDLIEVSRFDARVAPLHAEDLDLRTLVAKTLELRGWAATDDQVQADLPTPVLVHADPRRIDAILANLIHNALRHGSPPVTVSAHTEQERAVITVSDQGPGIPDDALPHVFERFYKADTAHTNAEGSGLGLAIAYENALLQGGTLTATNAPAGGAVFTLTLPLAAPPQDHH